MSKISLAGSDADIKAIQRDLLELGDVPNRWRGWGSLLKREREGQFLILQVSCQHLVTELEAYLD